MSVQCKLKEKGPTLEYKETSDENIQIYVTEDKNNNVWGLLRWQSLLNSIRMMMNSFWTIHYARAPTKEMVIEWKKNENK